MNLLELRTAVFAQADWAPTTSPEAIARVNGFINRALHRLTVEAPFAFFETTLRIATMPDFSAEGAAAGDGVTLETSVSTGRDHWSFVRNMTENFAYSVSPDQLWDVSGGWDGNWLEVTLPSGERRRSRIRRVWVEVDATYAHIQLVNPIGLDLDAHLGEYDDPLDYRVYASEYPLPPSVVQVNSVRLYDKNNARPLDILDQREAEDKGLRDAGNTIPTGRPRYYWKGNPTRLQAPSVAPAAPESSTNWGHLLTFIEPAGQFEYVYTLCWGKRDYQLALENPGMAGQDATGSAAYWASNALGGGLPTVKPLREPKWESPPSPPVSYTTTTAGPGKGVDLTMPDIKYILGYDRIGADLTDGYTTSGFYYRVYRKRVTVDTSGSPTTTNVIVDDTFYLLGEVPCGENVFTDYGAHRPFYERRLRYDPVYHAIEFYPRPDARYELDIRCVVAPDPLTNDYDAPPVRHEAAEALIQAAMVNLHQMEGNPQRAMIAEEAYEAALSVLRKRYGSMRPAETVMQRKPAQVRRTRGGRKWW